MRILLRWASLALAFWVATQLVPGKQPEGKQNEIAKNGQNEVI